MTQRRYSIKDNKSNMSINDQSYGSKMTTAVVNKAANLIKGAMSHRNQVVPQNMVGSLTVSEDDGQIIASKEQIMTQQPLPYNNRS